MERTPYTGSGFGGSFVRNSVGTLDGRGVRDITFTRRGVGRLGEDEGY
jgi:hypothetical protein